MFQGYKNKMYMSKEVKKVSIYDPSVKAFREYTEEEAKKFFESAKKAEAKLKKYNDDELEDKKSPINKEKEND